MPTTTPRSSHVGQPGYDSKENWQRFVDKYRERLLQFGYRHYPGHRDMVEDVLQSTLEQIFLNPFILAYKPPAHFRSFLIQVYNRTFQTALRKQREQSRKRYLESTAALREETATQDCDVRRMQLLAIGMIRENLLDPDYPNGRFTPEYPSLDRMVWQALQEKGATIRSVARRLGLSVWTVFKCNQRVERRIVAEARALLASQGLL